MPDVSYVPGPMTAVTGDQCWVLVEASPDSPAVTRIWQHFGRGAAADELLVGLLADGGVPGFALLTAGANGQHRLFCRGGVGAVVSTRPGEGKTAEGEAAAQRVDGAGLLTWREHLAANAERIFLGEPPADSAVRLPATSGVLLAGSVIVDFTNLPVRETPSQEPEKPSERPKKAVVFFPDTITVPPPDGQDGQVLATGAFAAPDLPGPPQPAMAPPAEAPPAEVGPAWGGAGVAPGLTAEAAWGGAAWAGADPAAGPDVGAGSDGEYDFLWGATQMRTVEDAAVRGPGDGGPLPPGQFPRDGAPMVAGPWAGGPPAGPPPGPPPVMPPGPPPPSRLWPGPDDPVQPGGMPPGFLKPAVPLPAPPGGLIDVPQWLAGPGESASTVKRAALPEPVAPAAPPDRIGPVVPALVCPNGHVNPPSGAACRSCGAPLPHDPVPVPRPVLGVLRLSNGDVISLDRGVVMGRSPRTDFAGPDGEERPHVVKLPNTDGDVSRTHLRVALDGWHVLVTDLNSTNGTLVTLPGRDPQQLRPGEQMPIQPGTVVTLAEGVDFRYEVTE